MPLSTPKRRDGRRGTGNFTGRIQPPPTVCRGEWNPGVTNRRGAAGKIRPSSGTGFSAGLASSCTGAAGIPKRKKTISASKHPKKFTLRRGGCGSESARERNSFKNIPAGKRRDPLRFRSGLSGLQGGARRRRGRENRLEKSWNIRPRPNSFWPWPRFFSPFSFSARCSAAQAGACSAARRSSRS